MAASRSFVVYPFTAEKFFSALAASPCTEYEARQGDAVNYLVAYLDFIGAKTIVTELEYVDADYLDDYSHFYAKSFENIPNRCRRLHFFCREITDDSEFLKYVRGERAAEELQQSYLGFLVARPLPTSAVIGRTALATYPSDNGRRHYSTLRQYHVNLFGIGLAVNSLAFQVQDTSLAACATVALWSCFQKTQDIFKSLSPTPVAITRAANQYFLATRPFPSRGLQVHQICNAIASVGLDPEVYPINATLPLSSLIYSYLRLGLPVLLVVNIGPVEENNLHAITLTGYSLKDDEQLTSEGGAVDQTLPKMIGARINEFYGHDDQKGPFCRLKMESAVGPKGMITIKDTGWGKDLLPQAVIVPVYPKIRTGFRDVLIYLPLLATLATWGGADPTKIECDVFLTGGNDLKNALRGEKLYANHPLREPLLLAGLPKYLWRCILQVDKKPVIEMLLDTTAMVNGFAIRTLLWHDDTARKAAASVVGIHEALLQARIGPKIVEKIKESL